MVAIAKVFSTGHSQAVRLPKAFRVRATEMWITRNESTGEITLTPKPDANALNAFMQILAALPETEEFVPARDDARRDDPLTGWVP